MFGRDQLDPISRYKYMCDYTVEVRGVAHHLESNVPNSGQNIQYFVVHALPDFRLFASELESEPKPWSCAILLYSYYTLNIPTVYGCNNYSVREDETVVNFKTTRTKKRFRNLVVCSTLICVRFVRTCSMCMEHNIAMSSLSL